MPAHAPAKARPLAGAVAACAAQFLVGADGLAVAIALPAIQRELPAAPIDAQWILTAYGLAFGGGLLLGGRLGDLYGRRRLLVVGLALFGAGAVLGGAAPGLGVLIAARALQGAGSAAAVPAALALIGSLFPAGAARTRALAILAAMASLGVTAGLLLGGAITAVLGWRWVFLLMAPLALATMAAARTVLPEARADRTGHRPDVAGALLVTAGLVAVLFGLTRVERHGAGAAATIGPVAAGIALLATFVAWERRAPAPLVRLDILGVRSLRAATLCVGVNAIAFTAIVYVGTLYLQNAVRYSPVEAGLAILPLDVVAAVVPLVFSGALARRSPRVLLTASFALTALALLWLARARTPVDYAVDLMAPLVVLGISLSVAFVVLTNEAVAEVDPDEKGVASGIFETSNHLFGGAVGVALYATIIAATASAAASDTSGYRAAFLAATALALLGVAAAPLARGRPAQSPRAARSAG
ncbi:MAG TPA: MFS transporter [Solirubrobacteraceae bacterium]|nr:MFS transporter [Solirubrobacteraceae bacterium]